MTTTAITGKAVWTTAAINDLPDSSFLYVESGGSKDSEGKTTPRSLRHFPYKDGGGKVDLPHLRNAIARIPQSNAPGLNKAALQARAQSLLASSGGGDGEKAGKRMQGGMLQKLRDVVRWAAYDDQEEEDEDEEDEEETGGMAAKNFSVIKTEDGEYRWVTVSSSAFVDREGEIVSTKALEEDVARADKTGQRGPLILWHQPGTEIGDCDFQAVEGRLLIESGTFRETEFATTVRKALQRYPDPLGVSIGFRHTLDQPDADGIFHSINIHERSVCPLEVAANPWTSFETLKETSRMDETRKKWFSDLVGAERAEKISALATSKSSELENLFAYKAALEPEEPAPEPPPEEPPDEPEAADFTQKAAEFFEAIAETVNDSLTPAINAIKAQDDLIERMFTSLTNLSERLEVVETAQKALTEIKDPTPAERARAALRERPTESEDNVIDAKTVEALLTATGKAKAPAQPENPVTSYVDDILKGNIGRA